MGEEALVASNRVVDFLLTRFMDVVERALDKELASEDLFLLWATVLMQSTFLLY
jgi:hypothetical protein